MKFLGFDGRYHSVQVSDYIVYDNDTRKKSELHLRARALVKKSFPCETILEEVTLPGSKRNGSVLYADFLIPGCSVMIEVQGEQHSKFIPFFHGNADGFKNSKKRDMDKREWCELNNITLIELPFGETDEQWTTRLS